MAHHPALYQTILEQPHDDAARLIYADWLEENGDLVRAEFIRLQCRLAGMDPWEDDYVPLRERMLIIQLTAGKAWLEDFPGLKDRYPRFVRGFVGEVSGSDRWWLHQGRGFLRRTPIEHLWLEGSVDNLEAVLSLPATAHLNELHLRFQTDHVKRAHLELLANSTLPALQSLDLSGNNLTSSLLEPLATANNWPALRELRLRRNFLSAGGLGALVALPSPLKLTSLCVADCNLERPYIDALFGSSILKSLHTLDLSSNRIGLAGHRSTWQPASLGGLRSLKLDQAMFPGMPAELAGCPAVAGLRSLSLAKTFINPVGFKRLAWAEPVQALQELRLEGNTIGDGGMAFLSHAPVLPRVNILDVSENELTADGIVRLLMWPGLRHVRELRLGLNPFGDAGLQALAQGPVLPYLTVLHLLKVNATDAGLQALAASSNFPHLMTLVLGNNQIGDAGARALLESKTLPHLHRASLGEHRLSPALRKAFGERFVIALTSR